MGKYFINAVLNAARHDRLDYSAFVRETAVVRKRLGLRNPSRSRRLPRLLSPDSLRRFYEAIDSAGVLQHQILLRLLFYTGIRVSELISIRVTDVNLAESRIFIESGKGDKDRYVLFPADFRLTLQAHLAANPDNEYLFESRRKTHYSARQIQYIVKDYAAKAQLDEHVHPHLFRHQFLTWLTKEGLGDGQIQLISGHASKQALEVYQHLGLGDVQEQYQEAMRKVKI